MNRELQVQNGTDVGVAFEIEGQVTSVAQNISQSGMLCRTAKRINEMTLLDIRFKLPECANDQVGNVWVECSGVVVNCEKKDTELVELPYEVAIFFDRISEQNRNILAQFGRNGREIWDIEK